MPVRINDLKCSGCGGALSPAELFCKYCGNPVVITSFDSVFDKSTREVKEHLKKLDGEKDSDDAEMNNSIHRTKAFAYLKLCLYDEALKHFKEAIEDDFDNPEVYFYAAVALLRGRKAFLASLSDIKKVIEYVNAAIRTEERGVFHYFLAYIKQDYHERKGFNADPDYREELVTARNKGLSAFDAEVMFKRLGVACPEELKF
jgi:tetratricopeptide (TPR) repeat protein